MANKNHCPLGWGTEEMHLRALEEIEIKGCLSRIGKKRMMRIKEGLTCL